MTSIPKFNAVERLVAALQAAGVSDRAARVIAPSVTDPAAFRRALQDPTSIHTPSGELIAVHTRVWTLAVIPHPTSVRLSPRLARATSGSPDRTLRRPMAGPDGSAELVIRAEDCDHVVSAITKSVTMVSAANPLNDDIGLDGIIEPVTLVPLTIVHDDEEDDITVLTAVDGSSRIAGAYQNLGVRPERVLYEYTADRAAMRGRLGRWVRLAVADPDELEDDEIRQLNSVTAPAVIVVGFRPSTGRRAVGTFAQAVESRVGAIHVAPPTPWSEGAQLDAQLDAALDALEATGALDRHNKEFLAGDLTPEEARASRHPTDADVRAALLLAELHRPANVVAVHDALRSVAIRRPSYRDRAALAAEGALRAFRNVIPPGQADAARNPAVSLVQDAGVPGSLLDSAERRRRFVALSCP